MKNPSVCFVCHEYPPDVHGGVGTFTQVVSRALVRSGWHVRVIGFGSPQYSGPETQDDQGVIVIRLRRPARDFLSVRAVRMIFSRVSKWARHGEIDLVELPDAEGWAAGWPALPIPVVCRVHGSSTYFARELGRSNNKSNYWFEKFSIRRADSWCAVSQYAADKTREIFGLPPVSTISYVPVELPPDSDQLSRRPGSVAYTGTLTPKKGIGTVIRAWPAVLHQVPEAELHVYGKDTTRQGQSMKASLIGELPPEARNSIHFHGHCDRPELLNALKTAAVAVFPSYAEAFAFAPLEAMATGCPTIYSRRTSGPELMTHNEHGLLVDPDQPADVAAAIVSVLQDPVLAARLGQAGRERVRRHFTIEHLMPKMESFYRECIHSFGSRGPIQHAERSEVAR